MVYLLFMGRGMIGTLFAPTGIIFEDGLHASIGLACLLLLLCSGIFMLFRALTRRIGRYDDRP